MKKIFTIAGLALSAVLLSGCDNDSAIKNNNEPSNIEITAPAEQQVTAEVALPETVNTQPGKTVEEELNNIDKDLQSIDDSLLNQGLSDSDLGL